MNQPIKRLNDQDADILYRYLKQSNDPMDLLVQFLFETGCRVSELLTVKIKNHTITDTVIIGLKSSNNRQIQLSANLTGKLNNYLHCNYLSECLNKQLASKSYRRIIHRHCTLLGQKLLSKKLSPHMLRHTAFSRLYVATKDLLLVKQWAGHKSINSTMVYLHADMTDQANDAMSDILRA